MWDHSEVVIDRRDKLQRDKGYGQRGKGSYHSQIVDKFVTKVQVIYRIVVG